MIKIFKKSNIAFVGGGKVCKSMLKILLSEPFSIYRTAILGVADIDDHAEGLIYAKNKGIFTTRDYRNLYKFEKLNLIIELTGNDEVVAKLKETKPLQVRLLDHFEAMSLWDFLQIEENRLKLRDKLKKDTTEPEKIEEVFDNFTQDLSKIIEERTEHLQTVEKELIERERILSQIVQGTAIPTFVINKDHIVTHWNKAMERLAGFKADEIVGTKKHWVPFYPEKRPTMADVIVEGVMEEKDIKRYYGDNFRKSALIEGAYESESFWPNLGKNGKWLFFTAAPIKSPDGNTIGAIETLWDTTATKQLQHEREKQIRQLRALWAISSALSASLDLEESLQTAVGGILAHLDVDSAGIYLKDKTSDFRVAYSIGYSEPFYQQGSKVGPDGIVGEVVQKDEPMFFEDVTILTTPYKEFAIHEGLKSAAYFPLASKKEVFGVLRVSSHTSHRFFNEDKDVLALISNFISLAIESAILRHQEEMFSQYLADKVKEKTKELEESYQKLQRSEERYRLMFNADPHSIFILDRKTLKILDANKTAVGCYEYSRDEFRKMTFLDLAHKKNDALAQALKNISSKQSHYFPKKVHRRKRGGSFYVNIRLRAVRLIEEDYLIATTTDVTEHVETEAKLIQAGKMATLGTMASGIAHEINQPLNVIQVCSDFFLKSIKKGEGVKKEDLRTMAEEIGRNVQRAAEIIKHMKDFARQSEVERHKVDINRPIRDVFKIMGQQLRVHQIELKLDLDDTLPPILAVHNRLEQVFINLVSNAMDALDEKGQQADGENDHKYIKIKSRLKDNQVMVTVSDNGPGIPEEIRDKIFEPFFTTKKVGKGTGLGISISYGIIKDYGGSIEVKSEVNEGTTFELKFPPAL